MNIKEYELIRFKTLELLLVEFNKENDSLKLPVSEKQIKQLINRIANLMILSYDLGYERRLEDESRPE